MGGVRGGRDGDSSSGVCAEGTAVFSVGWLSAASGPNAIYQQSTMDGSFTFGGGLTHCILHGGKLR